MKTWHACGLLFVAVFAAYLNALDSSLVGFDDQATLFQWTGGRGGPNVLENIGWILRHVPLRAIPSFLLGRELRNISLLLDQYLFGQDLWGYHLTNALYHWGACCFAFLISARVLKSSWGALCAALIFALHPVQTESVAYLGGRRDVLMGFLALLSFHLWLNGRQEQRPRPAWAAGAVWLLALSAKQSAIALPLLAAAHRWTLEPAESTPDSPRRRRGLWALAAAAVALVVVAHVRQEAAEAATLRLPREFRWHGGGALAQWATEPRILLHALKLLVWPARLSADYSHRVFDISGSFLEPRSLLATALLTGLAWGAWLARRRQPAAAFAIAWVLLSYLPTMHLLPTTHNMEPFAEHWLYLPALGVGWLVALVFMEASQRRFGAALTGIALVLGLSGWKTARRNKVWKDDLSLWSATAAAQPRCARAQANLGLAYFRRGNWERARSLLEAARALRPDDPKNYINLAVGHFQAGEPVAAEAALKQALHLPLGRRAFLGPILYHLGLIELARGRLHRAWADFRTADKLLAGMQADDAMGYIRFLEGRHAWAEGRYQRVLISYPLYVPSLNNLGLLYVTQGRFQEAAEVLERALALSPGHVNARINLGRALTGLGRYPEALVELNAASRAAPNHVAVWLALSELNRAWSLRAPAVRAARRAVALENSPACYRELLRARQTPRRAAKK